MSFAVQQNVHDVLSLYTDTTGLQSSHVIYNIFSARIICEFADGTDAMGCRVSFGSLLDVNISLVSGSTVAMENVNITEGLRNIEMVTVAEILLDGSVSAVSLQAVVTTVLTTTSKIAIVTLIVVDLEVANVHGPFS